MFLYLLVSPVSTREHAVMLLTITFAPVLLVTQGSTVPLVMGLLFTQSTIKVNDCAGSECGEYSTISSRR